MRAATILAFLHGVSLGVLWECASMAVLIAASIVEYSLGTLSMAVVFVGIACSAFACARQAQLARPLLSILAFRLSAQCAMTFGTGSVLLATLLHDTPACTSSTIRSSTWRAPLVPLLRGVLPPRLLRRIFGVVPPRAPPFLRLLAAVLSHEWLGWVPSLGLPSAFALPGTISFRPSPHMRGGSLATGGGGGEGGWLAVRELAGVYTYGCYDSVHADRAYIFRYKAFWIRPAAADLLHTFGSLLLKMVLMRHRALRPRREQRLFTGSAVNSS
mmetsp:Transcript_47691/g.158980  ORF Transcript_47691/g.158980 Transcript_47691/m.158980 type:complete len:272 (-) Transcript_47691:575-1390(-)